MQFKNCKSSKPHCLVSILLDVKLVLLENPNLIGKEIFFLPFFYLFLLSHIHGNILIYNQNKDFAVGRRDAINLIFSTYLVSNSDSAFAAQSVGFKEYIDTFDGYSFNYPLNWIQVRGAGADIFFRDPFVLDENLSVEISSPSSSQYKSVEDLGSPQDAGKKVLRQYLTEFMSTRLGVRRQSSILSTSSRTADDGKLYYLVEVSFSLCFFFFLILFFSFSDVFLMFFVLFCLSYFRQISNLLQTTMNWL